MQLLEPPAEVETPETYSGSTTLLGRLNWSDGRTVLELADGTVVRLIGHSPGLGRDPQHVEIEGFATWDILTNAPRSLRVAAIRDLTAVDVDEAFQSLAMAAGSHWGDCDAVAHLKRIRGEEE